MFRNGEFTSKYVEPAEENKELRESQIQPNGVDLTIGKIYMLDGPAFLGEDEYVKQTRTSVPFSNYTVDEEKRHKGEEIHDMYDDTDYWYTLSQGAYIIEYGEIIEIPEDHVGFVYPRSRLNRCAAHLTSAVWDGGYRGKGEGCLMNWTELQLQYDMRIGQLVLAEAEAVEEAYDGTHQGENLDNDE